MEGIEALNQNMVDIAEKASRAVVSINSTLKMQSYGYGIAPVKGSGSGFNRIKKEVTGINNTTLSATLSILEKYGLLERVIIPVKPVRVNYSFTEKGREFYSVCVNLASFIEDLPDKQYS